MNIRMLRSTVLLVVPTAVIAGTTVLALRYVSQGLPVSGSGTQGIEIVRQYRTLRGDAEVLSPAMYTTTLRFLDAQHFSVTEVRGPEVSQVDGGASVRTVVSGSQKLYEILDKDDVVLQRDVSSVSSPGQGTEETSTSEFALQLVNINSPVVDVARVSSLASEGVITQTASTTLNGRTVRTYEFPDSVVVPDAPLGWIYSVQVVVEDGMKLDVKTTEPDGEYTTNQMSSVSFTAPIEPQEFAIDMKLQSDGAVVERKLFDDVLPGMEAVLAPEPGVICTGGYAVSAPELISDTMRTGGSQTEEQSWTVLTQLLSGSTPAGTIVQAPEGQYIFNSSPVRLPLMAYWPQFWHRQDATELSNGWFISRETRTIDGGIDADVYTLKEPVEVPGRGLLPEYRHEVTWVEDGTVRVVALDNGQFTNLDEFVDCVSTFRQKAP